MQDLEAIGEARVDIFRIESHMTSQESIMCGYPLHVWFGYKIADGLAGHTSEKHTIPATYMIIYERVRSTTTRVIQRHYH